MKIDAQDKRIIAVVGEITGSIVLLAGLSVILLGCSSEYNCDCIGDEPYNFAKAQISKEFEATPYVDKLVEGNSITFIYSGATGRIDIFKVNQDPNSLIGIGYSKDERFGKTYESILVFRGKQAITYENHKGKWVKICSEMEYFDYKDFKLHFSFARTISKPKTFFGFEKEKVSNEEIQKYLDLVEELKRKSSK